MSVSVLTLTAIAYNRYQGKYVDNVEVDVNLGILETCPQLSTTAWGWTQPFFSQEQPYLLKFNLVKQIYFKKIVEKLVILWGTN